MVIASSTRSTFALQLTLVKGDTLLSWFNGVSFVMSALIACTQMYIQTGPRYWNEAIQMAFVTVQTKTTEPHHELYYTTSFESMKSE